MPAHYKIKTVVHQTGVHRPMLVSLADGIPLFNPTYYLLSMHVSQHDETNTQRKILESIQFLLEWSLLQKIDIEKRFSTGNFLNNSEIESLCANAGYDLRYFLNDPFIWGEKEHRTSPKRKRFKPVSRQKDKMFVKDATTAQRLLYVRLYLDWLAREHLTQQYSLSTHYTGLDNARSNMIETIKARTPELADNGQAPEGLSAEVRARILEVINPDHPENPYKSAHIRARNQLLFLYMDRLGIRRGEALLIKLRDMPPEQGHVNICAHNNDPEDKRNPRPEFKTKERPLVLSPDLLQLTNDYIRKFRSKLGLAPRRHGYLFVACRSGAPLSLSSADEIYKILREKVSGIPRDFSFHALRYTWNDRFCAYAFNKIKNGEWTEKHAGEVHADWCGWSPTSKMPKKYAKRYIREKANEVGLKMQTDLYLSIDDVN